MRVDAAAAPLVHDNPLIIKHQRRSCRIKALLDQVKRVEVPELGGAAELAAVEAERVESGSTRLDQVERGP